MSANIYFCTDKELIPYTKPDGTIGGCPTILDIEVPFNLSNTNAAAFLSVLGYDGNFWNMLPIPLQEFADAATRFLDSEMGEFVDKGTKTVRHGGGGSCMVVMCGRPEGYFENRIKMLLPCVAEAATKGATHVYLA
jgi:hypothetical protein